MLKFSKRKKCREPLPRPLVIFNKLFFIWFQISDLEDHRHLSRQLGRMSYIVSDPEDIRWQSYITELDAAAAELHLLCKSLCKTVEKTQIDGFQKIWNVSLIEFD